MRAHVIELRQWRGIWRLYKDGKWKYQGLHREKIYQYFISEKFEYTLMLGQPII